MTLPANVPKYRHPPETERFLQGMRSTQRVKLDEKGMRRNAESIALLTSGEIGQHYLGRDPPAVRVNMKPLDQTVVKPVSKISESPSTHSARSCNSGWTSNRSGFSEESHSHRSEPITSFRDNFSEPSHKYMHTLSRLDSAFGKTAKKDLITASLPARPAQELVWCATTIQQNALQSKNWSLKLRKDS